MADFRARCSANTKGVGKDRLSKSRKELSDAAWEKGFSALKAFKRKHGHFLVPRYHIEGTYRLGQWVAVQRYTKDALSTDRKKRLDNIGLVWSERDRLWQQNFAALKAFKRRYGHCRVPVLYKDGKLKLGLWVTMQRRKKSKMSRERRQRLNDIILSRGGEHSVAKEQ